MIFIRDMWWLFEDRLFFFKHYYQIFSVILVCFTFFIFLLILFFPSLFLYLRSFSDNWRNPFFLSLYSGTLNPALQDRSGRPKRDISTIIHILNDLLCATPQYRRHSSSVNSQSLSASSSPSTSFNHTSSRSHHHQQGGTSSNSSSCRRDYLSSGCEGVSRLSSVYEEG